MSAVQTLTEMGFSENAAKKAMAVVGGGGIEQAMEWLLAHADDPTINDEPTTPLPAAGVTLGSAVGSKPDEKMEVENAASEGEGSKEDKEKSSEEKKEKTDAEDKANSIKCDDCGKIFRTSEEVEYHAIKSGHENFSESTEEKKPLTEEEKLQKKVELAEKIKQRRKEREEEEQKEFKEREKKRIQTGQAVAERKRLMLEKEIREAAEERRREKMEDKIARQKVKEEIERDRLARKEMFANKQGNKTDGATNIAPPAAQAQPASATAQPPAQKKEYTTARLQIRLPSGTPLVQEFKAKESLSAVRLWVGLNRQDGLPAESPIKLSTSFPRKTFTEEDMDKPLDLLGLVPSAVLMVTK